MNSVKAAAIITAAGSGSRMKNSLPKQFIELAGVPVFVHTVRVFQQLPEMAAIILVVPAEHLELTERLAARCQLSTSPRTIRIIKGGLTRQESVKNGLNALPAEIEVVAVHDGVRPFVSVELIRDCLQAAIKSGAAMAAVPVKDTLKSVAAGKTVASTVARDGLWQAQTPQAARVSLLKEAYAAAERDNFTGTDEASLLERIKQAVAIIQGSEKNIKITSQEDLVLAEAIIMHDKDGKNSLNLSDNIRIGQGFDAHCLVAGRPLILGGVRIPHPRGLLGHSDADVLTHALCDAILGAIGAGDIGRHFPDTDPRFKDADSLELLAGVMAMAEADGYELVNADITVLAQEPKLSAHFPAMRKKLAGACKVGERFINLKATTTEKLGFVGREEGIAAQAVVLLKRN